MSGTVLYIEVILCLCLASMVTDLFREVVKQELRSAVELYGRERASNALLLSKIRALRGNIEV